MASSPMKPLTTTRKQKKHQSIAKKTRLGTENPECFRKIEQNERRQFITCQKKLGGKKRRDVSCCPRKRGMNARESFQGAYKTCPSPRTHHEFNRHRTLATKHAGPGLANQSRMGKSNQIRNRYGNTENNFRPVCYRQCSREAGLSERPEQV